ncbi:DUF3108 domain-containing protein [Pseudidiomarina taiwanensis]|uniref:DUF3108 domain-containing protein n=1 Tax=Pseudidiomarina taiwanensis TaxID=337250 RepID=A0A432ZMI9_9GAMM|nr:DUF3108 domain-containing protein [Pseudidiomarina taiwanensis]RUO79094.1 hypothetical protein CWI83_00820 [Pseudidiomarina taiwanensis]
MGFKSGATITALMSAAALFALSANELAAAELAPYQARYIVERGGSDYGEASRELSRDAEGVYQLYTETEISWLFISDRRRLWSEFSLADARVSSHSFRYKRSGTGKDRSFAVEIDHDNAQLLDPQTHEPMNVSYEVGAIDEASLLEQLRYDVSQNDATELSYRVLDEKGRIETQKFAIQGQEQLALPYAEIEAIKVARVRENSSRETYFWFAPSLNYVMVQMHQRKDGDEVATLRLQQMN